MSVRFPTKVSRQGSLLGLPILIIVAARLCRHLQDEPEALKPLVEPLAKP